MVDTREIVIRPLRLTDKAEWRRMWTAYLEFYETTVSGNVYTTTFARLTGDDPQDFSGLVAQRGEDLVGLAHYLFHRHAWKVENVCYLQDLYTDPEVRGTGVGRQLIEAVYAAADRAGAPSVDWLTQEFNARARHLYDRVGTLSPFIRYNRP